MSHHFDAVPFWSNSLDREVFIEGIYYPEVEMRAPTHWDAGDPREPWSAEFISACEEDGTAVTLPANEQFDCQQVFHAHFLNQH